MRNISRTTPLLATGLLLSALTAQAQLSWDPTISGGTALGGTGTWDTSTGNWWNGSIDTTWDNTGATTATFSTAGATEVVSIGSGLIVGDLNKTTGQLLQFDGSGGDQVITIKSGGATWDTGSAGDIEFEASAGLTVASGDTLTVTGAGSFRADTLSTAAWTGTGATFSYTGTGSVIGRSNTIGQFDTVELAVGMNRFVHSGANNDVYNNDWNLTGTGEIAFDGPSRNYTLAGDITGSATLRTEFIGNRVITLNGDNSAWTGGLKVGNASKVAVNNAAELGSGDLELAGTSAATGSGAVLLLGGVNLGSTRDLILSGAGGAIVNQGVNSFGGKITGSGALQIGHANHDGNTNVFTVSGTDSDHTGTTRIWRGSLALGADDALSHDTVLQIGGEGTSQFTMAGFDAEVAGLQTFASNTRQINNTVAGAVLTITTAGVDYDYVGNFNGGQGVSIVKNGLGTQTFNRNGGYTTTAADLTVNGGTLVWDAAGNTGTTTVGADGTLQLGDSEDSGGVGSGSGAGNVGDGNIANSGLVRIDRSDATSYSGVISGSGGLELRGNNTLTLNAAQTYTGGTRVYTGTLQQGVANAVGTGALTLGGSGNAFFDLNGLDAEIGGLTQNGGSTRRVDNNGGATATLTINVADGESYTYAAQIGGSGGIALVKDGLGTQIITTTGFVNDPTSLTVNAGTLIYNSDVEGATSVGVNGTLSGSGEYVGAVTVAGILNPGNSPGEMSFSDDLTLESTATTNLEFEGLLTGEFDVLSNDGDNTLTAGGTLALIVGAYTATLGDSFVVFENWGGFAGSFSSITGTDLGGGLSFDTSTLLTDGTLTVVPEPSTYALFAGLLAFVSIAARRRRS